MIDYRQVVQFKHNNNMYNMYLDNLNRRAFLRVDNKGNLYYPTIEEYIELIDIFKSTPNVMHIKKDKHKNKKIKFVPKVIIKGVAVALSLVVATTALLNHHNNRRFIEAKENNEQIKQEMAIGTSSYLSYESEEELPKDLVVDTYLESDWLNYLFIYDNAYLDMALDYESVSQEDFQSVIANNPLITPMFKDLLGDYVNQLYKNQPDAEKRIFYENCKTLEVVECTKEELVAKSLSIDAWATYVRSENKIYVLKGYTFAKGTWEYQVIFHEFSHGARTGNWIINGKKVKVQVGGQNFSNMITEEALNSLFAVSLFDYEERDIAYQLQSNYHKVMIECMDNYKISDYANHSLSYYAKKLDEYNHDENYATVILELIQMQYDDYHNDSITVDNTEYYPIYDYIAGMYFGKYIRPDMSYQEALEVADSLVDKLLFDVPDRYNIDANYFYAYLDSYCVEIGIGVAR